MLDTYRESHYIEEAQKFWKKIVQIYQSKSRIVILLHRHIETSYIPSPLALLSLALFPSLNISSRPIPSSSVTVLSDPKISLNIFEFFRRRRAREDDVRSPRKRKGRTRIKGRGRIVLEENDCFIQN